VRHDGGDLLLSSVREYSGQYLTIVSGSAARLTIQAAYFVLLANTLSLTEFGLFAGISAAGIIIGSFAGLGFASAAYRTAATRSILIGRYLAGIYATFLISTPLCIACAYLLYELAFAGRVALSTYLAIAVSDILLWRLLEVVSQVNNGLGNFFQASMGPLIGSGSRLVAAVIFKLTFTTLDEWALMYRRERRRAPYAYGRSAPQRRLLSQGRSVIIGRLRDSLLFAFCSHLLYTSELDKLIATLLVDGRTADLRISMRVWTCQRAGARFLLARQGMETGGRDRNGVRGSSSMPVWRRFLFSDSH
jgi:hypothetical protein